MTATDIASPVRSIDLHGYRMAYREWGTATQRPPLVLLHGMTSSSLSWIRVAPRLAASTRVIAVDLKGHGDSDRPAKGYRIADQAAEVAGLCQALGLQTIDLMGHSWGGGISLQVALDGGLSIRKLVLEDAGRGQPSSTAEQREARHEIQAGEDALAVARDNPHITLVTIADADHNIHRGRFDAFTAEVEPFLG